MRHFFLRQTVVVTRLPRTLVVTLTATYPTLHFDFVDDATTVATFGAGVSATAPATAATVDATDGLAIATW